MKNRVPHSIGIWYRLWTTSYHLCGHFLALKWLPKETTTLIWRVSEAAWDVPGGRVWIARGGPGPSHSPLWPPRLLKLLQGAEIPQFMIPNCQNFVHIFTNHDSAFTSHAPGALKMSPTNPMCLEQSLAGKSRTIHRIRVRIAFATSRTSLLLTLTLPVS